MLSIMARLQYKDNPRYYIPLLSIMLAPSQKMLCLLPHGMYVDAIVLVAHEIIGLMCSL
jgi:hypothetical protein